jgi:hypothetical protein
MEVPHACAISVKLTISNKFYVKNAKGQTNSAIKPALHLSLMFLDDKL